MKKIIILCIAAAVLLSACTCYITEETELYPVEKYVMHDTGIEVWADHEGNTEGYFFEYDDNVIHPCEEETSRVVAIFGASQGNRWLRRKYLYLSKEDFKQYLYEIYDLEDYEMQKESIKQEITNLQVELNELERMVEQEKEGGE